MESLILTSRKGSYLTMVFVNEIADTRDFLIDPFDELVKAYNGENGGINALTRRGRTKEKATRVTCLVRAWRDRDDVEETRSKAIERYFSEVFFSERYRPYVKKPLELTFHVDNKDMEKDFKYIESIVKKIPLSFAKIRLHFGFIPGGVTSFQLDHIEAAEKVINDKRKLVYSRSVEKKLETIFQ